MKEAVRSFRKEFLEHLRSEGPSEQTRRKPSVTTFYSFRDEEGFLNLGLYALMEEVIKGYRGVPEDAPDGQRGRFVDRPAFDEYAKLYGLYPEVGGEYYDHLVANGIWSYESGTYNMVAFIGFLFGVHYNQAKWLVAVLGRDEGGAIKDYTFEQMAKDFERWFEQPERIVDDAAALMAAGTKKRPMSTL